MKDAISFLAGAVFISPLAVGLLIRHLRRPGCDAANPKDVA